MPQPASARYRSRPAGPDSSRGGSRQQTDFNAGDSVGRRGAEPLAAAGQLHGRRWEGSDGCRHMRIRRHIRCLLRGVSAAMAMAVVAAACGGDASAPPAASAAAATDTETAASATAAIDEIGQGDASPPPAASGAAAIDTETAASATAAVDEIGQDVAPVSAVYDPATAPALGDFDVERLAAAAQTLDPDVDCPAAMVPESLENVAEVLRIERGCDVIEYVQLGERSVQEVRAELFASDETVYAVGLPPVDLVLFASQTPSYGEPPSPFDEDAYGRGEWWHLGVLDADALWDPDGWRYTTSRLATSGIRSGVPGWGDGEVIVAVVDSGVAKHRDLRDSIIDVDACHYRDTSGHGTHVAGLIAAQRGNGLDVAGIAPEAKILPIFLPPSGDLGSGECANMTLTRAIQMARRRGADVLNMSIGWGTYGNPRECDRDPGSNECVPGTDAAEAQLRLAQLEDIVVVAAAGNCASPSCANGHATRHYPAAYPGVLVVAATGVDNQRASLSKSNVDVDIAAPGEAIYSTVPMLTCRSIISGVDSEIWGPHGCGVGKPPTECPPGTPYPDGPLDQPAQCALAVVPKAGTSMAAPLVSGVIAHMKARYPRATQDQILSALFNTADPPGSGFHPDYGHGLIQPKSALEALDQVFNARPVRVSAGGVHSCLLRASGVIECWGQVRQSDVPSGTFMAVSAGGHHTCALRPNPTAEYGTVECWSNPGGGSSSSIREPSGAWFSAVSSGKDHSCGISVRGEIHCWGYNLLGQLDAPSGHFTAVSAGHNHSCGLKRDQTIECWGGHGVGESDAQPGPFLQVTAGAVHTCGLRTDRTIQCWGGSAWNLDVPSGQFAAVSAGDGHTCGLRTDQTIECWGLNSDGRSDAPAGRFVAVSAGDDHTCGLRTDQTIECWGSNILGQAAAPLSEVFDLFEGRDTVGDTAAADSGAAPGSDPVITNDTVTDEEGISVFHIYETPLEDLEAQAIPEQHPDTPPPSWIAGQPFPPDGYPPFTAAPSLDPAYPGGELPRPTEGTLGFSRWCVDVSAGGAFTEYECGHALHEMVWALDYLGADEDCVLDQYTKRFRRFDEDGSDAAVSPFRWQNCASAVNPDPGDTTSTLGERCLAVLPPDVVLQGNNWLEITFDDDGTEHIEAFVGLSGITCEEWEVSLDLTTVCAMVSALATEWMQHHYHAPDNGSFSIGCL